jgi:SAM-dependent methyltransferase
MFKLDAAYDAFPRIEEEFLAVLDESLGPRGPELLYEIVAGLALPAGATILDLGCGEGRQSIELARRFGVDVVGVDPVARHIELAREAAGDLNVRFERGAAESIPLDDDSVDLVWCREMTYFPELKEMFAECRRVLRPGGNVLIYQHFATDRMEPREAEWMWSQHGVSAQNADPQWMEASATGAGFEIERKIELRGEFGEYYQEATGQPARRVVHAARMLRDPQHYIERFGQANYDLMLADAFFHVYRMIGKLWNIIYLLRAPTP